MEAAVPDWSKLITELNAVGLSQQDIGEIVGCDQSHISDLKTGKQKEPRFSIGDGLLRLHGQRCAVSAAPAVAA